MGVIGLADTATGIGFALLALRHPSPPSPPPRTRGRGIDHLVPTRAGILVTGTEVLSGRVSDRNGPWLSERLRDLGVDLIHHTIVGDRPEAMLAALRFLASQRADLILTRRGQ